VFLGDQHVERGNDEECEDGADGHSAHQDEADGIAGGGPVTRMRGKWPIYGCQAGHEDRAVVPTGLARAVVRQHPSKNTVRAAAPSGAYYSGANAPFLYEGGFAAQVGRRRPPARSLCLVECSIPSLGARGALSRRLEGGGGGIIGS